MFLHPTSEELGQMTGLSFETCVVVPCASLELQSIPVSPQPSCVSVIGHGKNMLQAAMALASWATECDMQRRPEPNLKPGSSLVHTNSISISQGLPIRPMNWEINVLW